VGLAGWLSFAIGAVVAFLLVFAFRRKDTEKSVYGRIDGRRSPSASLKVWRVPDPASPGARVVRVIASASTFPPDQWSVIKLLTRTEAHELSGNLRRAATPGAQVTSPAVSVFSVACQGRDVVVHVTRPAWPESPFAVHLTPSAATTLAGLLDAAATAD
jgi:hypothetical protein